MTAPVREVVKHFAYVGEHSVNTCRVNEKWRYYGVHGKPKYERYENSYEAFPEKHSCGIGEWKEKIGGCHYKKRNGRAAYTVDCSHPEAVAFAVKNHTCGHGIELFCDVDKYHHEAGDDTQIIEEDDSL